MTPLVGSVSNSKMSGGGMVSIPHAHIMEHEITFEFASHQIFFVYIRIVDIFYTALLELNWTVGFEIQRSYRHLYIKWVLSYSYKIIESNR